MSLKDEIEEMLRQGMEGDPVVLDRQIGVERELSSREMLDTFARISMFQNRAILRLAEEIDKLAS